MVSELIARIKVLGLSMKKIAKAITTTVQNSLNATKFRNNRQPIRATHHHAEYVKKTDVVNRTHKLGNLNSFALSNHSHTGYVPKAKLHTSNGIHYVETDNTNYLNQIVSFVFARLNHQHVEYLPKVYITSEIISASKVQHLEMDNRQIKPESFFALQHHEHAEYVLKGECTVASSIFNGDSSAQPSTFALKSHIHSEHDLNSQFKLKTKGLNNSTLNAKTLKIIVNSIPTTNSFKANIQFRPRSVIKSDVAAMKIGASKIVPTYSATRRMVTLWDVLGQIVAGRDPFDIYNNYMYLNDGVLYQSQNIIGKDATTKVVYVFMDSDQFANAEKYLKRRVIPFDSSDITVQASNVQFYQRMDMFQSVIGEPLSSSVINAGIFLQQCFIPSVHQELQQLLQLKYSLHRMVDVINMLLIAIGYPFHKIVETINGMIGWIPLVGWVFAAINNVINAIVQGIIFAILLPKDFMVMFVGSSNDKIVKLKVKWNPTDIPIDDEVNALAGEWVIAKNMGLVVKGYEITDNQQFTSEATKVIGGVIGERHVNAQAFTTKAQTYVNLKDTYVYYSIWQESGTFQNQWVQSYTYEGTSKNVYLMRMSRPVKGQQILNQVTISQGKVTLQTAGLPSVLVLN